MKDFNEVLTQLETDRQSLAEEVQRDRQADRRLSHGEIEGRKQQHNRLATESYEAFDAELSKKINDVRAEIEELSRPVEAVDPLLSLNNGDLARAASLKVFLADDLQLSVKELGKRVKAAIESNDTVTMAVYSRILGNSDTAGHYILKTQLDAVLIPATVGNEQKINELRERWSNLAKQRSEARSRYTRFVGKDTGVKVAF